MNRQKSDKNPGKMIQVHDTRIVYRVSREFVRRGGVV